MFRQIMGNEKYPVKEVDGVHAIRVYATIDDFTKFIRSKLSDEQKQEFADCKWFPTRIVVEDDMTVDFTLMAVK